MKEQTRRNFAEGQKAYQAHSIHTAFVENYSHLWDKVIVYDAIAVE